MSLGKLLTAGKSLVGLHNSAARYQLRTGALPKFESQKNPFISRSQNEGPSSDAGQLTPAEIAAASMKDTQRLPLLTPKPEASGESVQPASPGSTGKGWDEVVLGLQGESGTSATDARPERKPSDNRSTSVPPGENDHGPETRNMPEVSSAIN